MTPKLVATSVVAGLAAGASTRMVAGSAPLAWARAAASSTTRNAVDLIESRHSSPAEAGAAPDSSLEAQVVHHHAARVREHQVDGREVLEIHAGGSRVGQGHHEIGEVRADGGGAQ